MSDQKPREIERPGWKQSAEAGQARTAALLARGQAIATSAKPGESDLVGALAVTPLATESQRAQAFGTASERLRSLYLLAYRDPEIALAVLGAWAIALSLVESVPKRRPGEVKPAHAPEEPPQRARDRMLLRDTPLLAMPLANMLGLWSLRDDMASVLLVKEQPVTWWELTKGALVPPDHLGFFTDVVESISKAFQASEIAATASLMRDSEWVRYLRRSARNEPPSYGNYKVHVAVRDANSAYQALGAIHALFRPAPTGSSGGFKDHIAAPKFNGYRALSTLVQAWHRELDRPIPLDVRIYSDQMQRINAGGILAHRESLESVLPQPEPGPWWADAELRAEIAGATEPEKSGTPVLSPVGEVIRMPPHSTALDFAYRIHPDVGNSCQKITVNGRSVPLGTELTRGNLVEVIAGQQGDGPQADWRGKVRTDAAKMAIKRALTRPAPVQTMWQRLNAAVRTKCLDYGIPPLSHEMARTLVDEEARRLDQPSGDALLREVSLNEHDPSALTKLARTIVWRALAPWVVNDDGTALSQGGAPLVFAECEHEKRRCQVILGGQIAAVHHHRDDAIHVHPADCPLAARAPALKWTGGASRATIVRVELGSRHKPTLLPELVGRFAALEPEGEVRTVSAELGVDGTLAAAFTVRFSSATEAAKMAPFLQELRRTGIVNEYAMSRLSASDLTERVKAYNRYDTGAGLSDPSMFKGRDDELRCIEDALRAGRPVICIEGLARTGKSSLLARIRANLTNDLAFWPIHVEMNRIRPNDEARVWARIMDGLPPATYQGDGYAAVVEAMERWRGTGRRFVLLVDELTDVDSGWDRASGNRLLERLGQLPAIAGNCTLVIVVQRAALFGRISSTRASSLTLVGGSERILLGHLTERAARELITHPMRGDLEFESAAIKAALSCTGGHPFYLQRLLHMIVHRKHESVDGLWAFGQATGAVTADNVREARSALAADGSAFFECSREVASAIDTIVLTALAEVLRSGQGGGAERSAALRVERQLRDGARVVASRHVNRDGAVASSLDRLVDLGILVADGYGESRSYGFAVPLFGDWLHLHARTMTPSGVIGR
jgi:(p)ppGpp synthase/HD superfamily hydrolase